MGKTALAGLPYYGGKSPRSSNQIGAWILKLLPSAEYRQTYVEPFAGMLGILLNRPKVETEIVNDSSEHIVHLWRSIRDYPQEMEHCFRNTLISESEFNRAVKELDESTGIDRALNTAIIIALSINNNLYNASSFKTWYQSGQGRGRLYKLSETMPALHQRIKDVQFFCRDALSILDRTKNSERCIIYCDPPYKGSDLRAYGTNELDFDAFKDLLRIQKGRVAVSSYGDFYDDLEGWHRHEKKTRITVIGKDDACGRTEVLWTNYDPLHERRNLFSI